jgi:hypothetical protein
LHKRDGDEAFEIVLLDPVPALPDKDLQPRRSPPSHGPRSRTAPLNGWRSTWIQQTPGAWASPIGSVSPRKHSCDVAPLVPSGRGSDAVVFTMFVEEFSMAAAANAEVTAFDAADRPIT